MSEGWRKCVECDFWTRVNGSACERARADKETKYAELLESDRCRLVVVALETGQVEFRSNPVRRKLAQLTSLRGTTRIGEASFPGLEARMGAHDLRLVCTSIRHVAGGRPGDARSGWRGWRGS